MMTCWFFFRNYVSGLHYMKNTLLCTFITVLVIDVYNVITRAAFGGDRTWE